MSLDWHSSSFCGEVSQWVIYPWASQKHVFPMLILNQKAETPGL